MKFNSRRGFTLIETILYTGILSVIIGSFLLILYNIAGHSESSLRNIDLIDQKQFIIQKIDWFLQSVAAVNNPTAGSSGAVLSVNKVSYASNPIVVDLSSGVLRVSEGGGGAINLTPTGITVSGLSFTHTASPNETRVRTVMTLTNAATSTTIDFVKIIR